MPARRPGPNGRAGSGTVLDRATTPTIKELSNPPMANHPRDRFDDVTPELSRVGAHRAPAKKWHGWVTFGWAALATGILVAAGVVAITVIDSGNSFDDTFSPGPVQTPLVTGTPVAPAVVDGSLLVTVLNGTETEGLAGDVAESLADDGWTIGSRANASDRDVETTTVYYWAAENEGAARGLAESLGAAEVVLSDNFAPAVGEDSAGVAALTAVLGSDYLPPA